MKSKIAKIILAAILSVLSIGSLSVTSTVFAVDPNPSCSSNLPESIREANGCNNSKDNLSNVVINIINVVMGIIALVAVVAIIISGVQYMTSTGDPGKVKKAKDTILYAVIGLVVVALATAIVNFVIRATTNPPDDGTVTSQVEIPRIIN